MNGAKRKYIIDICPECKVRDNDSSKKRLYKCHFCGKYFCKRHIAPRLAIMRSAIEGIKDPVLRDKVYEEWRKPNGHPDRVWSENYFEKLKIEKERELEKRWEALERLKETKKIETSEELPKKIYQPPKLILSEIPKELSRKSDKIEKIIGSLILVCMIFSVTYTVGRQLGFDPFNPPEKYIAQIYTKTNEVRSKNGLQPLEKCDFLDELAKIRVKHISDYYAKTNILEHHFFESDTTPYLDKLGKIGENAFLVKEGYYCFYICIPWGTSGEGMVDEWMDSPGHRSNLLSSDYKYIGIGINRVAEKIFAVQVFSSNCPSYQQIQITSPTITSPITTEANELNVSIKKVIVIPNCIQEFLVLEYVNHPCLSIELEIENKLEHSTNFMLSGHAIVCENGSQVGIYSGLSPTFTKEGEKCYVPMKQSLLGETLFPGAKKTFNLCFPIVEKNDKPKLYADIIYNFEITEIGEYKGQQKEYVFDLTPYL